MPHTEIETAGVAAELERERRQKWIIAGLAVLFVIMAAAFTAYYFSTKNAQQAMTPQQKAIAEAQDAITKNPKNSGAYVRLGVLYTQSGLVDDAIKQFDEALKLVRDDQEALLYAGIAYLNKDEYDMALKYFNKEIKYYKNTALAGTNMSLEQAYYYGGVAYWKKKDYDKSIEYLIKAVDIKPSSSDTHYLIGRIYLDKQLYDDSIVAFEMAVKLDPAYANALFGLGRAYEGKGDKIKALEYYKAALKSKPGFSEAKDAADRLEKAK